MLGERVDIAVVGAGAAGLFAAIWAGRRSHERGSPMRIVALDGAKKLGAKILVAGGGRCNVTHHAVDESAYAGGSRNAIRTVLRSFSVDDTVDFFKEFGVDLKREDTGKLFPTTDDANTIRDALLQACEDEEIELRHPWRVGSVTRDGDHFRVEHADAAHEPVFASRVILCAGGMALPKSGSDGAGYELARALGHTTTPLVFPALVPIVIEADHWIRSLSGIATPAELTATTDTGKRLASFTNSTLCTHFGLSGPGPLDISRYLMHEARANGSARLIANWLPSTTADRFDQDLADAGREGEKRSIGRLLLNVFAMPERLAVALLDEAGVHGATPIHALSRDERRAVAQSCCACDIPFTGDRGFTHAEVTAGGVPLTELVLKTMSSKACDGLHLAGEILDVDGRIGGFNFQWAWASGYLAGRGAADALVDQKTGVPSPP